MAQVFAGYLVLLGWINNTFAREPAKRAVAIALMNSLGQIGNVIGSSVTFGIDILFSLTIHVCTLCRYVWPSNWGPTYRYSYVICIVALGVSTGMFGGMHLYFKRLNKQIERDELSVKDIKEVQDPIGFRYVV
jgi:hypothetical protein